MVVGSHINAEVVAHGPDILRAAEQAGTMGAVLTLQAMLVKKLAELVDMLRIQVAIHSHAPFGAHIVNRELHRHQTKGFSAFFDAHGLRQRVTRGTDFLANPTRRLLTSGRPFERHVENHIPAESNEEGKSTKKEEKECWQVKTAAWTISVARAVVCTS
jgi:hypothetical protein